MEAHDRLVLGEALGAAGEMLEADKLGLVATTEELQRFTRAALEFEYQGLGKPTKKYPEVAKAIQAELSKAIGSDVAPVTSSMRREVAAALVGQGIVRAVSVGYVPEAGGVRRATDIDKKKYGEEVKTIFSRWKLLEVSLAPLQANPEALITAVKKGICSPSSARKWFGIETPKRTVVTISIPAASSTKSARSIKISEAVEREIARARGRLYL